jgi:hypothetical protein
MGHARLLREKKVAIFSVSYSLPSTVALGADRSREWTRDSKEERREEEMRSRHLRDDWKEGRGGIADIYIPRGRYHLGGA